MQKVFNNQKKRMKMLQDMEEEHTHLFTSLQKSAQTILRLQNDNKAMKKALDKAQKDKEELVADMKKRIAELDA